MSAESSHRLVNKLVGSATFTKRKSYAPNYILRGEGEAPPELAVASRTVSSSDRSLASRFVNSDRKHEPSYYPALAAFDIKVDRKSKFPVLPLAIATVCRTIANAHLRRELTKGGL